MRGFCQATAAQRVQASPTSCTAKPWSRSAPAIRRRHRGPSPVQAKAEEEGGEARVPIMEVTEALDMFRRLVINSETQRSNLEEMRDKYGPIFCGNNVLGTAVVIGEGDLIKGLIAHEPSGAVVPSWPQSAIDTFGERSIVFANGKTHQTVKKLLKPSFLSKQRLKFLHSYVLEKTDDTLATAAAKGSFFGRPVEFNQEVDHLYFALAVRAAVGPLSDAERIRLHRLMVGLVEGFFVFVPDWLSPAKQRSAAFRRDIVAFLERIVSERRAGTREGDPGDAIGALLAAVDEDNKPYTDADIAVNCLAMLFAGTLAMSNAATTVACLSADGTELRDAVLREIATWPEEERRFRGPLDFDRLHASAVLDSAVAEALRWAPPVPGMFRRVEKDVDVGRYAVTAGSNVIVSIMLQAHDPQTYREPGRFCPMRFLPGFGGGSGEPKPMSFGNGPHLCLGAELAKSELKVLLALLVRDYTVTLDAESDQTWGYSVLDGMKRKDGGRMVIGFRTQQQAQEEDVPPRPVAAAGAAAAAATVPP